MTHKLPGVLGTFKNPRVKVGGYWTTLDNEFLLAAIWGKTEGDCIYCWRILNYGYPRRKNPTAYTIDHFIPKKPGGGDNLKNLVPACYECNNQKADQHPRDWLSEETYLRICFELGI